MHPDISKKCRIEPSDSLQREPDSAGRGLGPSSMTDEPAIVWYSADPDNRVWCVRRGDVTVRAQRVDFPDGCTTAFKADGFMELQPGGPRGIIQANSVILFDEAPL